MLFFPSTSLASPKRYVQPLVSPRTAETSSRSATSSVPPLPCPVVPAPVETVEAPHLPTEAEAKVPRAVEVMSVVSAVCIAVETAPVSPIRGTKIDFHCTGPRRVEVHDLLDCRGAITAAIRQTLVAGPQLAGEE